MGLAGVMGVILDNLAPTIVQDIISKRQYWNKIVHNIWFWCLHKVECPSVGCRANTLLNQSAIASVGFTLPGYFGRLAHNFFGIKLDV